MPRAKKQAVAKPEPQAVPRNTLVLRPYQQTAREKFMQGYRRQMLVWHRRAGKDIDSLDFAAEQAEKEVGTYWHLYPTHVQAKRAIWNGIDSATGERFLERAFPIEHRKNTRIADMQIEMNNGSMWQLCGSDRYDSLVGSDVKGVIFSEFALQDPRAWDYIRPIIRANDGWVRFITTYRGRNHAYQMAKQLQGNPNWFIDVRTVDDTADIDGNRIITAADIEAERAEGMSEALIQQEYYCNPMAAQPGAIYGLAFDRLIETQRLGNFAYDASLSIYASWSLEWDDQFTVAFFQTKGNEARIVGSQSYPFAAISDCLQQVSHNFPWRYIARHIVPHNTPAEIIEKIEQYGAIVEQAPKLDSVTSVTREQLATTYIDSAPRAWTDEADNNERLIDALNGYRFKESRGGQSFTNTPVNSWEKHYARTIEVFSAWREDSALGVGGWHERPSTHQHDRAVI